MKQRQTVNETAQEAVDLFLKGVIEVLLAEPHSKRETAEEIIALIHTRGAGFNAVGRLLEEMGATPAVVDFAIELCLEKTKKERPSLSGEALSAAGVYIAYGASDEVKNRVILEMARAGWYGRIEHLTRKYLSRDLTAEEARLLVRAYLKNKATRNTEEEKHLLVIAKRCLDEEEAAAVEEKIREFGREFDSY